MRQRFQSGQPSTLRFYPPEAHLFGTPTSAAVTIKTSTGTDLPSAPVNAAAAVVDPVNTTLAQVASEGDRQLILASVAGVAPRKRYRLATVDGEADEVEVVGVNAGAARVIVAEPIRRDYAVADLFQGEELSFALTAAQNPDPAAWSTSGLRVQDPDADVRYPATSPSYGRLFRAAWSYVIAGVTYTADQLYEVRKRILKPTLTADQVQRRLPAKWTELVDGGPREVQKILDDTWDDVLDQLTARGFDPDRVMDVDRLRKAHRSLVIAELSRSWGADWKQFADDMRVEFTQDLTDALNSADWYDVREDSIQSTDEVKWPAIVLTR